MPTAILTRPGLSRAERRRARQRADLGPERDPIRQQGRDPLHVYNAADWFATSQPEDSCRTAPMRGRRRLYHNSYGSLVEVVTQDALGKPVYSVRRVTPDQVYESLAEMAAEYEAAGINLGWGGCSRPGETRVRRSVDAEVDRRYLDPRPNSYIIAALKRNEARRSRR